MYNVHIINVHIVYYLFRTMFIKTNLIWYAELLIIFKLGLYRYNIGHKYLITTMFNLPILWSWCAIYRINKCLKLKFSFLIFFFNVKGRSPQQLKSKSWVSFDRQLKEKKIYPEKEFHLLTSIHRPFHLVKDPGYF